MSDHNGSTNVGSEKVNPSETPVSAKGKGKAVDPTPQDMSMDEDDETSEEEEGAEEEGHEDAGKTLDPNAGKSFQCLTKYVEEEDADNMEEISTDNIINDGRRTRGKTIDFAQAAQEAGEDLDDDEDDDDDFEDEDAMKE
ncbi:Histone H2A.Z-specific chaperone [Xylographa trunciseda]|nr:Histone H2A.Z-specific chaperone [Xylographa trunciseda]